MPDEFEPGSKEALQFRAMLESHGCDVNADSIHNKLPAYMRASNIRVLYQLIELCGKPAYLYCGCLQHIPGIFTSKYQSCALDASTCARTSRDCQPGSFCRFRDLCIPGARRGICTADNAPTQCTSNSQCVMDEYFDRLPMTFSGLCAQITHARDEL
jgi:hypothetical protein